VKPEQLLYVGIKGRVLALNRASGEIVWEGRMTGGQMVTLLVDGDQVFATASGEVFAFNAITGEMLWHNSLPGMGLNLASLATTAGSSSALLQQARLKQQQDSS
jgi:hypothetical protein